MNPYGSTVLETELRVSIKVLENARKRVRNRPGKRVFAALTLAISVPIIALCGNCVWQVFEYGETYGMDIDQFAVAVGVLVGFLLGYSSR